MNPLWLVECISFPDIVIASIETISHPGSSRRTGRPQNDFESCRTKTKRRRIQHILETSSQEEISMAAEKWCRECQIYRDRKRPKTEDGKSVTGCTSTEKLSDRTPRFPSDILFGSPGDTPSSPNEDLNKLEARLESVQTSDRERVKLSKIRKKTHYDSGAADHHFKKSYLVWVCNPKQRRGLRPKPRQKCEGPYCSQETE
ncbi:hypothetical protein AVEN_5436-1 [Araneus ventricosus]|uniref:Uncharacterized protein n=1 Tax=Araneus ventricosus TaxID=182803 RepID=A0A4Y2P7G2_ARAVE|nr:hypothetical protein AVEN_5436-1 [Araneus ventricosus]